MNLLVYFQLVLYIAFVLTKVSLSNPNSGDYEEVTELDNGEVDSEELRERARSAHEDVHRKEESEKALEQVFAACTNACSITTAGVKLREALEKNREYEKVNEVQKQTIRDQEITISDYEDKVRLLSNQLGAEQANHNELQSEHSRKAKALSNLEAEISIAQDKMESLTYENGELQKRLLELNAENERRLELLEKANDVVSNLKRENLKLYNELKEANVQMQAQKEKQNLIANFESTLAQIHSKISNQIIELNETKESRIKDRDVFLAEQLEFKKYSEEKEKILMAKQKQAMEDKIEAEAAAEVVNQNSNVNIPSEVPRKDSISSSVLGWIFENTFYSFGLLILSSIVCSRYGDIWIYKVQKFIKPRTVRNRNDKFSASTPARLMPTPRRGSREEISNFAYTNRNVMQSPMRQRFR